MDRTEALDIMETVRNKVPKADRVALDAEYASRFIEAAPNVGSLALAAVQSEATATTTTATTPEATADLRNQLLSTADLGARLFLATMRGINAARKKVDRIPLLKPGEYRERFEDKLSINLLQAAAYLPATASRPRLLIPRLLHPISRKEVVEAIGASSDNGPWRWNYDGTMDFLSNFPLNALSGYDGIDPDDPLPQVVPTAYDNDREGTASQQRKQLKALQAKAPEIRVAPIFMSAILGYRYKGQDRHWQDTHTRAIDQKPVEVDGRDCVPDADVRAGSLGVVDASPVRNYHAARLLASLARAS